MAFVSKRVTDSGTVKWDVEWHFYVDGKKRGRSKTFDSQKEAKKFLGTLGLRKSKPADPFKVLTESYLEGFENAVAAKQREESSLRQLRQHINLHILPDTAFSSLRCEDIGTPEVQAFLDRLYKRVSPAMTAKVRTTLSQLFKHGAQRGYVTGNPVRDTKIMLAARPEAGEDGEPFVLPSKDDLRGLREAASSFDNTGKAEAIIRVWMFGGLRASELRGLPVRKLSLGLAQPKLRVDQRADRYDEIGPPKSKASRRDIPLGADTVKALKRWLEARAEGQFVFPNEEGGVWSYQNIWNRFWVPLMNHAGLVTDEPASATVRNWSKAQAEFKQPAFGPHMLRHVYASLQIERGVQPKRLQVLMGHATLKLTMDTYGHLWPDADADNRAANVESMLS